MLEKTMKQQQKIFVESRKSQKENFGSPMKEFGSAESLEQEEFDQSDLTDDQIKRGMQALIALYREQKTSK